MSSKVAVVTGASKGIGLSIVKGLCKRGDVIVYLTSRDEGRGRSAVAALNEQGLFPEYHQLDVEDRESIMKFRDYLASKHGGLDILINNAAVADINGDLDFQKDNQIININFKSILKMQELVYPLVRENGRILNISSDCGHLSNIRNRYWIEKLSSEELNMNDIEQFVEWFLESSKNKTFKSEDFADGGTVAAYRVSKVALSAATIVQQKQLADRNISVNSMHPGLVRTDMTEGVGFYSADEAAETPLYLVLDAPASLRGAYVWYDRQVLNWYDYNADYYFKIASIYEHLAKVNDQ